jgi:hypothetical protein
MPDRVTLISILATHVPRIIMLQVSVSTVPLVGYVIVGATGAGITAGGSMSVTLINASLTHCQLYTLKYAHHISSSELLYDNILIALGEFQLSFQSGKISLTTQFGNNFIKIAQYSSSHSSR